MMTKTAPTPLARALAVVMSDVSEDCWAAGWDGSTSEGVWSLLVGDDWSRVWAADADTIATLAALSEACGCWVVWDDECGEVAVPLDEWRAHYGRWLADHDARYPRPRLPAPIDPGGCLNPLPAALRPDDRWTPLAYDDEPLSFATKVSPTAVDDLTPRSDRGAGAPKDAG